MSTTILGGKNKEGYTMKSTICGVLVGVCFLLAAVEAHAADCDFTNNVGKVKRIYPERVSSSVAGTFFHLHDGITEAVDGDAYYFISALPNTASAQSVYKSTQDLLIEAAKSGWTVNVRTTNCGTPATYPDVADVAYLFVDFLP